GRAGHRREGPGGLRGGGQAAGALRKLVEGPPKGPAQGPAPQSADHADPVGTAAAGVSIISASPTENPERRHASTEHSLFRPPRPARVPPPRPGRAGRSHLA